MLKELENAIKNSIFKKVNYYESIDSTNSAAFLSTFDDNEIFVAESQTAGRGRLDRKWFSPSGENIYLSLKLIFEHTPISFEIISLTAISLRETIFELFDIMSEIKWPNDILINGKKCSGTLSEQRLSNQSSTVVIGVGINCNSNFGDSELSDIAISLSEVTGKNINRLEFLKYFLEKWSDNFYIFNKSGFLNIFNRWLEYSNIIGRHIFTTQNGVKRFFVVEDVKLSGELIVINEEKSYETLYVGDCFYVN
ncbi:biotin--[acetyl-CoA-carboxylase] ligase [bacterium]|nr:biotin--[acetyl-CoA-carboxylase] ligase [bacterium]